MSRTVTWHPESFSPSPTISRLTVKRFSSVNNRRYNRCTYIDRQIDRWRDRYIDRKTDAEDEIQMETELEIGSDICSQPSAAGLR